ncbi:hypothetical protein EON67_01035 [archaeon]|nr:MAG: hypothetical protein EON67_01035 [archaeon]
MHLPARSACRRRLEGSTEAAAAAAAQKAARKRTNDDDERVGARGGTRVSTPDVADVERTHIVPPFTDCTPVVRAACRRVSSICCARTRGDAAHLEYERVCRACQLAACTAHHGRRSPCPLAPRKAVVCRFHWRRRSE